MRIICHYLLTVIIDFCDLLFCETETCPLKLKSVNVQKFKLHNMAKKAWDFSYYETVLHNPTIKY